MVNLFHKLIIPSFYNLLCDSLIHLFLADRTNGRAIVTLLRLSSAVCL